MNKTKFDNNRRYWFILIGLLIISFIAGGYWYDQQQIRLVRNAKYQELKSVSRLKINQLSDWRDEAIFNAEIYAQNHLFSEAVSKLLKQPENISLKDKIREEWNLIRINDGFSNVILTGLDGAIRLALEPNEAKLTLYEKELVQKTLETGEALFSDLFRCPPDGATRIDVMAPVIGPSNQQVAALILRIDPEKDLYPFLEFWPTSSESSETYIVRQENDQFTLLNRLRTEPQRELFRILPLSLSTVKALEKNLESGGIFEGQDSRGTAVVAYISRVPNTAWIMVSQVDKSEILADARYHAHFIALIVFLLILITVIGSALIYRHQRVRLYKELFKSEKERNELLEESRITLYSIGDGVISMDESGRIRHMNPAAETLTGWSETQARGKSLNEVFHIIHEMTREKVESPAERVLQKKEIVKLPADTILVARNGAEHPIADTAAPINKEKDKLIGIVVVFSDVTAERKAQRNLQISEERYRTFFMEGITGNFVTTPDGKILDCNPAYARILGFESVEETKQHNTADFYPSSENRENFLKLLVQSKNLQNYEIELRAQNGKPVYVLENVFGIFDSEGNLVKIRGYLFDITERKKFENQFLQAQKMDAIGRLAGGVAHDFNNMLGVILGYCDILLLKEAKPGGPLYEKLFGIKKAALRSADLTRQLLAFARKQIIAPKVLDLNDSIENMLKMLQRLIGEDIDLVWKPGRDMGTVKMDPSQIDQILANLLVNARDAIDGVGKVTIETDTIIIDQSYCDNHIGFLPGEYVLLSASDDGCGMDKDTLAQIFEPFFTTKEEGRGTGLGLATVYGIVKQNNGFINAYSEPGKGTKFSIYIPKFDGAKTKISHDELMPNAVKGGTETILLVEDEEQVLNMAALQLEDLGYIVLAAHTPAEALYIAETYSGNIDLLITDVVLPELDGRELTINLSAIRPELKCIYMSGYTANAIAHQGVLEEGVNFLQKPFSREELASKIRNVLDSRE